jgi:hypothetical protein
VKAAVLDDYQGAARSMTNWDVISDDVDVRFFEKHQRVIRRTKPKEAVS